MSLQIKCFICYYCYYACYYYFYYYHHHHQGLCLFSSTVILFQSYSRLGRSHLHYFPRHICHPNSSIKSVKGQQPLLTLFTLDYNTNPSGLVFHNLDVLPESQLASLKHHRDSLYAGREMINISLA